jgi:hypothetical protein
MNSQDCATSCQTDPNCGHYFTLQTAKQENKCLLDTTGNTNALRTSTKPPQISSGSINIKRSKIMSTCGNNGIQPVHMTNESYFSNYETIYTPPMSVNNPANTFYCADPNYQALNGTIQQLYRGDHKEGFTDCGEVGCVVKNQIPELQKQATGLSKMQTEIHHQYQSLDTKYQQMNSLLTHSTLWENDNLQGNNNNQNNSSARPGTNIQDARKNDEILIRFHQHAIISLATVCFLTFGIVFLMHSHKN